MPREQTTAGPRSQETLLMARCCRMVTAILLGSLATTSAAFAQSGAVSLTHTVTVTVPARVKVAVTNVIETREIQSKTSPSVKGLALSIRATQPWALSIGSPIQSPLRWSRDDRSGFSSVDASGAVVASGEHSQTAVSATVFVQRASGSSFEDDHDAASVFVLTIVAK